MGVVSSSKAKSANMKNRRSRYLVYAELHGFGKMPSAFDEDKAGRPVERRLNRIQQHFFGYPTFLLEFIQRPDYLEAIILTHHRTPP